MQAKPVRGGVHQILETKMSDKWEVKSVTRAGDGFSIKVGPRNTSEGSLGLIGALVLALATMDLFELQGWEWLISLVIAYCVVFVMFPILAGACAIGIFIWWLA